MTYKHIVLAIKYNSKWGSVGLSRRRELYYKDLVYDSLAELFLEYKRSYERVFHTLKRVKVGLPLPHEVHAGEIICWSYVSVKTADVASASQQLADHGRSAHRLADQWRIECKKAKELGQKPPVPPQQLKKQQAAAARKALAASGLANPPANANGASDSDSDVAAEREVAEADEDKEEPPPREENNGNRPSFLAV